MRKVRLIRPIRLTAPLIALALLAVSLVTGESAAAQAQVIPPGFTLTQFATGLIAPTAMTFAPDGRLFVAEQGGALRVFAANGADLGAFLTVTPLSNGERGLLGVALDPDFAANGYVYIYYTVPGVPHNRVSRFTTSAGDPNVADPASEFVVLDLDPLNASNHNGGALHFGPDGKLYIASGDNARNTDPADLVAQSLDNLHGKILRINPDGAIPTDNPYYMSLTGDNRAIYNFGLRNPYTFAFQPGTGRMFINDVGQATWEEVSEGFAGVNYGWPYHEGPGAGLHTAPSGQLFANPVLAYGRTTNGFSCAISGGAFYNPDTYRFPAQYAGDYFFADFCGGWIGHYDTATGAVASYTFATHLGAGGPVDLRVHPDGRLFYLTRNGGAVFYISYTAAPEIIQHPASQAVIVGDSATFSCLGAGGTPISYQWRRDGVDIPGADSTTYAIPSTTPGDSGAVFTCRVSNGQGGSITSNPAALFVNPIPPTRQPRPTPGFEGFDPAISALGFLVPREIGVDGEQLEWVITVTNRGSASGSELIITDTLRDGLRIDRVDVAAGSASISGQTVTVAIPALAPGSSVRFSIFTTVITGGPEANNTTCVTAANISAQTCTRALAVRTLPTTGETPYWRALLLMAALVGALFVIIGAGLVTSAGGTQDK